MNLAQLVDRRNIGWIDLSGFTLITALAIFNGVTTIFYVIYLFWWKEVLARIVGFFFRKTQPEQQQQSAAAVQARFGGAFLLFIYFVFIVVFFGILANWANQDITITNFRILLFQDWFFNATLIFILVEHILLHYQSAPIQVPTSAFSANLIVLHISIILGGLLMFFVVKRYPDFFGSGNAWGSLVIVAPFLLLRLLVQLYFSDSDEPALGDNKVTGSI